MRLNVARAPPRPLNGLTLFLSHDGTRLRYKTLFRILGKAIGLYFMVMGASSTVTVVAGAVAMQMTMSAVNPARTSSVEAWRYVTILGPLLQLSLGLYLFFGGRFVANLAVPGNRPYCPECGYDLGASPAASPCPECGVHRQSGRQE